MLRQQQKEESEAQARVRSPSGDSFASGGTGRSERGSEIGSGASSFSEFSGKSVSLRACYIELTVCCEDADLSESLESALLSNMSGMSNLSLNQRPSSRL